MEESITPFPTRAQIMWIIRQHPQWSPIEVALLANDRYAGDGLHDAAWARLIVYCDDLLREFNNVR